jgi:hypothetical protein
MLLGYVTLALSAVIEAIHNGLIDIDVAIPDFDVIPTFWICAYPCLVLDRSALTAKIR